MRLQETAQIGGDEAVAVHDHHRVAFDQSGDMAKRAGGAQRFGFD